MRRLVATAAIAAATLLVAGPAAADPPGQTGAFTFRFGGFFPSGSSDFWDTNESKFTLDHSDFNSVTGGVGYTASINNYFEFDVNADFYAASSGSANRLITDSDGFPILHDTRLSIFPLTVGFRVLPGGRYARRGAEGKHLVRRPVPYIGAGIGGAYWQYEEEGDFVYDDFTVPELQSIFYDRLQDTGFAFEKYAMVGIEFPVAPVWNISLEARRSWAEATPSSFFPSLISNPIPPNQGGTLDLGGWSITVGGALRF
jgi:hypothetical protein